MYMLCKYVYIIYVKMCEGGGWQIILGDILQYLATKLFEFNDTI